MEHILSTHDPKIAALSLIVACVSAFTALDLSGRARDATGRARTAWSLGAALSMGGGVWAMHFVAMLALRLPPPVTYGTALTLASLGIAVAASAFAFAAPWRGDRRTPGMRGAALGLGVAAMHHTGMAAMDGCFVQVGDPLATALSILWAVAAASLSLWLASRPGGWGRRLLSGAAMGTAVFGMHFVAMASTGFLLPVDCPAPRSVSHVEDLALGIAAAVCGLLAMGLVAAAFDRRDSAEAAREAERLRRSEERLRDMYRSTPLPLYGVGPGGTIEEVSDAFLEMLGYERSDVVGRIPSDFMTPESARLRAEVHLPSAERDGILRDAELDFVRRDGAVLNTLVSARVVRGADGGATRTLGGVVDVTARRAAEAALRQAQKMEAVGQLTGGLAHDFNNMLTVITGNLDGAAAALERGQPDRVARYLGRASEGAASAAGVARRLLAFSRGQEVGPVAADVGAAVLAAAELARRAMGAGIEVSVSAEPGLWCARIDPSQFENAVLNLAINARDAMPEGGRVTIEAANVAVAGGAEGGPAAGDYVSVSVSDTGPGFPPEVAARAFEPFFTTKGPSKGTGLGLSMVYGFAQNAGGHASIGSSPGGGARISLLLPRCAAPEGEACPA